MERPLVFEIGSLYAHFQGLHDKRKPRGLRYPLALVLLLIVLAKLCGEDRPSGIAEWAKHRADLLAEWLKLGRKSMPHHSTYRRILADGVCVEELEQVNRAFLSEKQCFGRQVLVAIDGKVLRGTIEEGQKETCLLAAYLPEEGIVLMEVAVEGKGSEIPAAPTLLKTIDLRGKVVMGDALHTQREISKQIVQAGGEYIWFVKGNQAQMEEEIRLWFEADVPPLPGMNFPRKDLESVTCTNKGHGRIEQRTITVSSQLKDFLPWPYVAQVFKLVRRFTFPKTGKVQEQVIYGITSLSRQEMTPGKLLQMTRSYWGIENGLHYRRDVTLLEDRTRMTKGKMGHAMACINNLVIGILLGNLKYRYLPSARRYFNAHPAEAFALLTRL
ncbi:MAG: ISAs1 family transposase [Anaerolineales bacterium]|nr:ISAs1 family transposase [Anaerolineales bacterium]